jgi:hypothetical protein
MDGKGRATPRRDLGGLFYENGRVAVKTLVPPPGRPIVVCLPILDVGRPAVNGCLLPTTQLIAKTTLP